MDTMLVSQLLLLLSFVETPGPELPQQLFFGDSIEQVEERLESFADWEDVDFDWDLYNSEWSDDAVMIDARYGLEDAADRDLQVQALFDEDENLLGVYAYIIAEEPGAYDEVAFMLDQSFGGGETSYVEYYPVFGDVRVFAWEDPREFMQAHLSEFSPGESGGSTWRTGVLFVETENVDELMDYWAIAIEFAVADF